MFVEGIFGLAHSYISFFSLFGCGVVGTDLDIMEGFLLYIDISS